MVKQQTIYPIAGVRLAAVGSGVKPNRDDLALIELDAASTLAGVFTKNAFCAAPVHVAKQHLISSSQNDKRYLLINAGNANAGTGDKGLHDAQHCCEQLAEKFSVNAHQVLPFSTGVIGEYLALDKICNSFGELSNNLDSSVEQWQKIAAAIMTTDTFPKLVSKQCEIDGQVVSITGIAKGAGMIKPNMATMLGYVATDAVVEQAVLQNILSEAADLSFNSISVDGDTSTNDACMLIATGASTARVDETTQVFVDCVQSVFIELAQSIIRDAEGATKFIELSIENGQHIEECRQIGFTIAESPLVKTAFFASDPNWGRILAAIGRAGICDLDVNTIDIYLDDICIVEQGSRAASYTEEQGAAVMKNQDITIRVNLNRGDAKATLWTCDFSYDYVKINAEYRT